jgi:hypothetical protein
LSSSFFVANMQDYKLCDTSPCARDCVTILLAASLFNYFRQLEMCTIIITQRSVLMISSELAHSIALRSVWFYGARAQPATTAADHNASRVCVLLQGTRVCRMAGWLACSVCVIMLRCRSSNAQSNRNYTGNWQTPQSPFCRHLWVSSRRPCCCCEHTDICTLGANEATSAH